MALELEELQIVFDANTEKIQESLSKLMPMIEQYMTRLESITGRGMDKAESNLSMGDTEKRLSSQMGRMANNFERMMNKLEKTSESSSKNVGTSMAKGFSSGRKTVNKEIDALVKEIDAKMGQAKAQQEKIAYLRTQRQSASSKGDSKGTVRYDEQIANAEAKMTKLSSDARGLASALKREFDAVPASLQKITAQMSQNEAQIESMRKRVKDLKREYADQRTPVGSFEKGFNSFKDNPQSLKTNDQILKQSSKMNKLIADNDKLQQAYATTEDRASQLKSVMDRLNHTISQSSMQTGSAVDGATMTGSGLKQSEKALSRYGGLFNRTSNNIAHASGGGFFSSLSNGLSRFGNLFSRTSRNVQRGNSGMTGGMAMFSRQLKSLIPQLVVYGLLYQGISKLSSGLWTALKTNQQFSNSLNQIKVNLMTAFYPIYSAILPAINALAYGIARVTGILASFISMLFGTTFSAAKQGASNLYDSAKAITSNGSAADNASKKVKKLQSALAGFDEINTLNLDSGDEDGGSGSGGSSVDPNAIDFSKATQAYQVPAWLKDFFKPFQDAWNSQGAKVIKAWKYALSEIKGLAESIGKSFMEVWTNGTGQLFIENILVLLADVLNIIGDIAKAFKDAWNDDGGGTRLIQTIFNMFNSILGMLHAIATAFREAWNDGTGESIAAHLLDIYTNIFNTIGNIADAWKRAFESDAGKSVINGLLDLLDIVLGTLDDITESFKNWSSKLNLQPLVTGFDKLVKAMKPLVGNIGDGLKWLIDNVLLPLASFTIEDLLPAFLDALAGAIDGVNGVINGLKPAFDFFWNSFLKPIAEWTGGVIVDVLKKLGDALSGIGDFVSEHGEAFSNFVIAFATFAGVLKVIDTFTKVWTVLSGVVTFISSVGGLTGVLTSLGTGLGGIITVLGGPWAIAIAAAIAVGVLLWKNWDKIKEVAGKLASWIGEKWDSIKTATSETWNKVTKWSSDTWSGIKTTVSDKVKNIASTVSEKWGNIKKDTSDKWDSIKKATSNKWSEIKDSVTKSATSAKDKAVDKWREMSSKMGGYIENIKSTSKSGFDRVAGWAGNMGSKIGQGLSNGYSAVRKGAGDIANGIVGVIGSAVNGVINGINWVLRKVGASGSQLGSWAVPKFARGGRHKGGLALVNDANSKNWQEMYKLPNGKLGMFPRQKNLLVNMEKGTQVLDGNRTANLIGAPKYAGGIFDGNFMKDFKLDLSALNGFDKLFSGLGGFDFKFDFSGLNNLFSGGSSFISNTVSNVIDTASDIWDMVSNPSKLLSTAIDKFVSLAGVAEPAFSIAKGGINTIKNGAFSWFKKKLDSVNPVVNYDPGKGVSQWRSVAAKALRMTGQYSEANLNALLYQMRTESGGNPKAINNWDINAKNGIPSKGLMQVIDPTFRAYAMPGHSSNIWDPLSNILASIRYATSRYGSLTRAYRGVGYELGGKNTRDGLYRLSEGNKEEWVIPMTKPSIAVPMIYEALNELGMSNEMTMPDLFNQPSLSSSSFGSFNNQSSGSLTESLINAINILVSSLGGQSQQTSNGDIVINIGGREFGRIAVSEINKYHRSIGRFELNM